MGWAPDRKVTYYYIGDQTTSEINLAFPYGVNYLHYFEAVPLTVEPKVPVTPEEANEKAMSWKRLLAMTPQLTDEARNRIVKETSLDPKGDAGSLKAPLYLLPSHPLHEASWVLKYGAQRYGPWNWRQSKVCASTYRSAMQRHLDQWFDGGEDMDSETQRSHLAHVIANACILMDAMKHETLADDRP